MNLQEKPTLDRLTRFEKVRIIGTRAAQLQNGMLSTLTDVEGKTMLEIAKEEFKQKKIPFIICRSVPHGEKVEIPIQEF